MASSPSLVKDSLRAKINFKQDQDTDECINLNIINMINNINCGVKMLCIHRKQCNHYIQKGMEEWCKLHNVDTNFSPLLIISNGMRNKMHMFLIQHLFISSSLHFKCLVFAFYLPYYILTACSQCSKYRLFYKTL